MMLKILIAIWMLQFYTAQVFAESNHEIHSSSVTSYFGCEGVGGEVELELRSAFFLSKSLADGKGIDKGRQALRQAKASFFKEAVLQHLKYAQGYFVHHKRPELVVIPLAVLEPEINSIQVSDAPYPQDLTIMKIEHPDVKIANSYLEAAVTAGSVKKNSPAYRVRYSAKLKATYCSQMKELKAENFQVILPTDPFLAAWQIPIVKWERVKWRQSEFTITPCADEEFADIPDPYYLWYFWAPQREKSVCRDLLKEGHQVVKVKPQLRKITKTKMQRPLFRYNRLSAEQPLKATIQFGVIDAKARILDFQKLLKRVTPETDPLQLATKMDFMGEAGVVDRGSKYFIGFLESLDRVLLPKPTMEVDQEAQLLVIKGQLKRSRRPIRIQAFFGHTDMLGSASPTHWPSLLRALRTDDVVLYNGHSGLGENFKLENLLSATGADRNTLFKNAPKHQIIGYLSCYSGSYFSDEIARARRNYDVRFTTDLIRTASDFTSERGPLGILSYFDRFFEMGAEGAGDLTSNGLIWPADHLSVQQIHF